MKLDEKRLSSSAMGDNFLYLWNTTGRLRIDLYHYIKRNNALGSYKLDDTSRYFLGEKVKGVEDGGAGAEKWKITVDLTKSKQGADVGRSLVFMNGEGVSLCDKLTIHSIEKDTGIMVVDAPADVEVLDVEKWAIVKDDLSPAEMFKLHLGTAEDRATIAKYCVQDCALVLDLFRKLEVFNNAMSMANVCTVPIGYIFIRGQGIKIESLIYKFCYENGQCIQVLPQASGNLSSYEGAIVLDPTPGFYTVPVGVADFASLYPSTIISENISHDTLVWVKEYDNEMKYKKTIWGNEEYDNYPGVLYTDIQFDNFEDDPNDTRKNKAKIKTGVRVCRYAQDTMGTIPQITGKLLAQRKATRKLIEKEPDVFRKALLDAEQLAYKVTANSLYGQLGSGTFKVRLQSLAASVTAYGRKQIIFAKDMIMEFYGPKANNPHCTATGAETVYGDSVTGDTPLFVRMNGIPIIITIERLGAYMKGQWTPWHTTKEEKDVTSNDIEVWTEKGWTKLHRVIRHKLTPGKKMYRIITPSGVVDCSEDHSLVCNDSSEVKPCNVMVGTPLLHDDNYLDQYPDIPHTEHSMNDKLAMTYLYISMRNRGCRPMFSEGKNGNIVFHNDTVNNLENTITSIQEITIDPTSYIYDLQTENHHFSVGPGALVVHNTDSLFICFNPKDPETGLPLDGRAAVEATIRLTAEAGKLVSQALKPPHDFEFDKVYWPFLIFSKKRYVGNLYESNADEFYQKSMGIALKRRDYAPIVKKIYGGAVQIMLGERNVAKATNFVREACNDLVNGKWGLGPLTISKSLRSEYANPNSIAHKVLADRMTARDPGNAPASGDRIPYVYILPSAGQKASALQGDRIEAPSYIREKGLKPDFMFYITNQISNPVCQMFGLLLERMPGFSGAPPGGWPQDDGSRAVHRENMAYKLLFAEAEGITNSSKTRAFADKFGFQVLGKVGGKKKDITESGSEGTILSVAPIQTNTTIRRTTQMTLDGAFADRLLIESMKKPKRKTDKKEK